MTPDLRPTLQDEEKPMVQEKEQKKKNTFSKYTPAKPDVQQAMSTATRPRRGSCPSPASPASPSLPESSSSSPELLLETWTSPTPTANIASAPHCLRRSTLRDVEI